MKTQTPSEPSRQHTYILWRCSNSECNLHHVRRTKLNWEDDIQSPCPRCRKRTRLNRGNTRTYEDKEDALDAKEMASGRWLR